MKLIVVYSPRGGEACRDGQTEKNVQEWIQYATTNRDPVTCTTSSELLVDWFRVALKERKLLLENFELYRHVTPPGTLAQTRERVDITQDGEILNWPDGFCDFKEKVVMRLLSENYSYADKVNLTRVLKC